MALELPTPVTRESSEAKTFPLVWLYNVNIHAPGPGHEARSMAEVIPMAEDGELYWPGVVRIETNEFMLALSEVPELTAAYEATLASIIPLQNWIEARKAALEEAEAPEEAHGDNDD